MAVLSTRIQLPRLVEVEGDWPAMLSSVLCGLVALSVRLSVGPLTYDDAYITFRYVRNLANGLGLVYNPGEHVLGTTTPLWTLILAVFYRFGLHDLPSVALVISSLADAATAYLLFLTARHFGWGLGWSSWLALLFAFCPLSIGFAASGMESSLFTLLAFAALLSGDRPRVAALLCGLVILCRPEGIIVAALVFGGQLIREKGVPLGSVATTVGIVVPWLAYSAAFYGSPLPESVLVKAAQYPPNALKNLQFLVLNLGLPGFDEPLLESTQPPTLLALAVGTLLLVSLLIFLPRFVRFLRCSPELIPLAMFAPVLAVVLVAEGTKSAHIFPWYLVPFAPFALLGIAAMVRSMTCQRPALVLLAVAAFSFWTLLGASLGRQSGVSIFVPLGNNLARERAYRQAALFLASRLPSNALIAAPEIGALGYFSDARILDTAGLVSPEAVRYYPLPTGYPRDITVPPGLIQKERPDAIVVFDRFLPSQLTSAAWFQARYKLAMTFDARIWGSSTVFVYLRH